MTYDYILVDTNLWYTRNYVALNHFTFKVGKRTIVTGGIWGFIKSIKKWQREFANDNTIFYFLFDNATSKSNIRQEIIDPTYKLNRFKRPLSFYRSLDYLRLILLHYSDNFRIVYGTGYEADDIVPYVLNKLENNKNKLLISEDLDWARLISKNIHLYKNKEIIDPKMFIDKFNFYPTIDSVTLYKVIKGDASDEIPIGVPNLRTKIVERLCNEYKNIYEVIENLDLIDYINDKMKKVFIQNKSRLNLNHQLISFLNIDEDTLDQFIIQGEFTKKTLRILYETLDFDLYEIDPRVADNPENLEEKDLIKFIFNNKNKMQRK